jgi:aryl-alcohol dehydrogenase-like predicted oxidoreductase
VALAPGYEVSRLIVGGWQLSAGHHTDAVAAEEAIERLVAMADMGLDTFDCADIYTGVEELLGRFLARWRTTSTARPLRIHTKFVPDLSALDRVDDRYVERVVDRSLRRLGVETLDLVQFYWWDPGRGDWLGAAQALGELQRAGKIRHLGAANLTADEVRRMETEAGVSVVADQVQYSVLDRRPEAGLTGLCEGSRTSIIAYGALAGGFLTSSWLGALPPAAPVASRSLVKYRLIVDEFGGWEAYQQLLAELASIASGQGVDASAIALRFVLDQPGVAAAIFGFTSLARARECLRALEIELTPEDHVRIRRHTDVARGPRGDVFGLERDREGPHGRIMRYDLSG